MSLHRSTFQLHLGDLQAFQCQTGYNIPPLSAGSIRISPPNVRKTSKGTEILAGCPNICWLLSVPGSTLIPSQGLDCTSHTQEFIVFLSPTNKNCIIFNFLCITLRKQLTSSSSSSYVQRLLLSYSKTLSIKLLDCCLNSHHNCGQMHHHHHH